MKRWVLAVAVVGMGFGWAPEARANDPATAQALFDQARKLMVQEKYAEACPKLEESQKLDPAGGTQLHLALCREREGRIATAWALYQDALSAAKRDKRLDRAKIAQERIEVLGPRLPKVRVKVAPGNRGLRGFRLMRDDVAVGEAQWSESVPIDPGAHVFRAEAEGRKPWSQKYDVPTEPRETTVEVPELEVDAHAGEVATTPRPDDKKKGVSYEDATRGDTQRTLGLVAGGIGIAGVVVGSIFGLVSISKKNEADQQCHGPNFTQCPTTQGVDDGKAALEAGNISTIAFIAGGALIAGGAILYFTAPDAATPVALVPAFGPRGGSLSLTARFR